MKKALIIAFTVIASLAIMPIASFAGPYMSFEQGLVPAGPGMPACDATFGFVYEFVGSYEEPGAVQNGSASQEMSIGGDLYITTVDLWSLPAVIVGHELNLGWSQVDLDLATEIDLMLAALSADLKVTGYITDYLTMWGRLEGTYSPLLWSLDPFIGVEFSW